LTASLARLQVSYVDLVFCHRPDPLTPTETVVRAMTDAVRSGKATAWGTSEWSAQQITEAFWIARLNGFYFN
jgi:aryl-alcohol dehydrogenase-like predicted oxidoreductase